MQHFLGELTMTGAKSRSPIEFTRQLPKASQTLQACFRLVMLRSVMLMRFHGRLRRVGSCESPLARGEQRSFGAKLPPRSATGTCSFDYQSSRAERRLSNSAGSRPVNGSRSFGAEGKLFFLNIIVHILNPLGSCILNLATCEHRVLLHNN